MGSLHEKQFPFFRFHCMLEVFFGPPEGKSYKLFRKYRGFSRHANTAVRFTKNIGGLIGFLSIYAYLGGNHRFIVYESGEFFLFLCPIWHLSVSPYIIFPMIIQYVNIPTRWLLQEGAMVALVPPARCIVSFN